MSKSLSSRQNYHDQTQNTTEWLDLCFDKSTCSIIPGLVGLATVKEKLQNQAKKQNTVKNEDCLIHWIIDNVQ